MTATYLVDAVMGTLLLVYCGFLIYLIRGRYKASDRCDKVNEVDKVKSYYTDINKSSQTPLFKRFPQYLENPPNNDTK